MKIFSQDIYANQENPQREDERNPFNGSNAQHLLDGILAALDAQAIPSRFKEIVNTTPPVMFFGIPLTPTKSTFEYEVWVFRSDFEKASSAIANLI